MAIDRFSKASEEEGKELQRTLQLTDLRDWCMERLSVLSLRSDLQDARSMTAEYLEMLMETNASATLWMRVAGSRRE